MYRQFCSAICVSLVSLGMVAYGQERESYVPYAGPKSVPGSPAALGYHHSATAGESILRGQADWMRGFGEMIRDQAESDCFSQTAYAQWLQNKLYVYDFRKYKERVKREELQAAKAARQAKNLAKLSSYHLPPKSKIEFGQDGTIYWPEALSDKCAGTARDDLDAIFAAKAKRGDAGISASQVHAGRRALERLHVQLKARVKDVSCHEYLAAKGLLRDLEAELVKQPQPLRLARQ